MKSSALTLLMACSLSAAHANAASYYGSVEYATQMIKISGERFHPQSAVGTLGMWVGRGIGLEFSLGTSASDDYQAGLTLDSDNLRAINIRFESPNTSGVSTYIVLGGVQLDLSGTSAGEAFPGEKSFSGYQAGIGMNYYLQSLKKTGVSISANRLGIDDNISSYDLRLGLRHDF